jgi:hypothetical protein
MADLEEALQRLEAAYQGRKQRKGNRLINLGRRAKPFMQVPAAPIRQYYDDTLSDISGEIHEPSVGSCLPADQDRGNGR